MMRLWGFEMIILGELEALGGKLGDHRIHIDILELQTKGRTYCDTSVALSPARVEKVSSLSQHPESPWPVSSETPDAHPTTSRPQSVPDSFPNHTKAP